MGKTQKGYLIFLSQFRFYCCIDCCQNMFHLHNHRSYGLIKVSPQISTILVLNCAIGHAELLIDRTLEKSDLCIGKFLGRQSIVSLHCLAVSAPWSIEHNQDSLLVP